MSNEATLNNVIKKFRLGDLKEVNDLYWSIHDKECIGCKRHNKHIMISFTFDRDSEDRKDYDVFLSQHQAKWFVAELNKKILQNEEETVPVIRQVMTEKWFEKFAGYKRKRDEQ